MSRFIDWIKSLFEKPEPARTTQVSNYNRVVIKDLDVNIKTHGKYKTNSNLPMGLVVHYTAGRFDKGPLDTMNVLAEQGFGCLVMDRDGVIYKAKNQTLKDVAYHAGQSSWRGQAGVSNYCLGIEMMCAGEVKLNAAGEYKTWWGQTIPEPDVRVIRRYRDNLKIGAFHKYTPEQESALIDFIMWQCHVNPEFRVEWVVGHDECAQPIGRKPDPGGSLSMTMPELRRLIFDKLMQTTPVA